MTPAGRAPGERRRHPRVSQATKAGLQFPVGRIHRYLKNETRVRRVSACAAVYMAAALEYLCADLMDIAGSITRDRRKKRITPRHILYAIKDDRELDELLRDVHVPEAGTRPWLHIALLPAFRPGRGGPASQRWAFQALSHDDNRRRY